MDLIIGNTSQLVHYFDTKNVDRVSSRNFTTPVSGYENVILSFAEQRTFLNLKESHFLEINVDYTCKIIDLIYEKNKKIIVFGTSELWNNYEGAIDINKTFNYKYSPYIRSKELLVEKIKQKKSEGKWLNVFVIHPFNFNSPHRDEGFIFGKIFNSILNKKIIEVGNVDINRDIIHPKLIVDSIKNVNSDTIIGSGVLTNLKDFIIKLYNHYKMDYNFYVKENLQNYSPHNNKKFWLDTDKLYTNLLNDTIIDIDLYKIKNNL